MSTIMAESFVGEALRDYLFRKLPAKVAAVNATRAAVLKARGGPYTVVGNLAMGADIDSESSPALTTGSRTAAQVAGQLVVTGLTSAAETIGSDSRLTVTSNSAPVEGTPSVVSLGPSSTAGANAAFGWPEGGIAIIRSALVAPSYDDIFNGSPDVTKVGQGPFQVVLGKRQTVPVPNIRRDMHVIDIDASVVVCEPTQDVEAAREYAEAAWRCVREVLAEDRTLDNQVQLVEWPSMMFNPRSFKFEGGWGSALLTEVSTKLRVRHFERS